MKPLVFVHGFMGGSRQWQPQLQGFSEFEVITLDLPGFGDNSDNDAFYSITDYATWALKELAEQGVDTFHLVGHSMGGMVALEMVAQDPKRIDQLVLYGTGATGVLPGRFETIETSKERACADGAKDTARRIAATWFLEREKAAAFAGCTAIAERSSIQAILAGLDAMSGWCGEDHLNRVQARTLVVWGDHDRTYPWSQTEKLWQSISGASLAVIPNCAHAPHLEKPELFNRVLEDFLTS